MTPECNLRIESSATRGRSASSGRWRTVAGVVLFVLLAAVFVWLALGVARGSLVEGWDVRIMDAIVSARVPVASRVFWFITLLGNASVMATFTAVAVALLFAWRCWEAGLFVGVGVGLGEAVSAGAKALFDRARPPVGLALIEQPSSASFPSGHALISVVVAGLLCAVLWQWLHRREAAGGSRAGGGRMSGRTVFAVVAVLAGVLCFLIGASRVYLGVHWASDVIGGWCLGGMWLIAFFWLARAARRVYEGRVVLWAPGEVTRPPAQDSGIVLQQQDCHPRRVTWGPILLVVAAAAAIVIAFSLAAWGDPLLP